jgi:hypothetical protein
LTVFNLFSYLSKRAREAVLAGVGQALAELDGGTIESDDAGLAELHRRFALPAPTVAGELPLPHRNGKRKDTAAAT